MLRTPKPDFSRTYLIYTHFYFLAAGILALIFYRERIQSDAAYYLFHVIDGAGFHIEHQRFILAFSQFLPLLGVKLGLSMKIVFILNSLNPIIWFYLLYAYCVFFLRDRTAGVGIILISVLGVLHMYFCPMYEIWYGSALLVLVYAHLHQHRVQKIGDLLLFLGIVTTVLFSHPLLIIPLTYFLIQDTIRNVRLHWKALLGVFLVIICWYITKLLLLTDYESGKLSLLDFSWNNAYEGLGKLDYVLLRIKYLFTYYTIPVIMLICSSVFYLSKKMHLQFLVLNFFFWGHVLLINITHYHPESEQSLYFERMYMPLIAIALLPFLTVFSEMSIWLNHYTALCIVLVVGWRFWLFIQTGVVYTERLEKTDAIIAESQKIGGSKFVLSDHVWKTSFQYAEWSFPMETMLYSAFAGPAATTTIALPEDLEFEHNVNRLNENTVLIRRWDLRLNEQVNGNYFKIQKGVYKKIDVF